MLYGTAASPGVALGKVLVLKEENLIIEKKSIQNIASEKERFIKALEDSKLDLEKIRDQALNELGQDKAAIFEAHLMILEDPELISETIKKIKNEQVNSEYAFDHVIASFVAVFESMDNEYMKERAADIRDVSKRILKKLLNISHVDLSALDEEIILVAHDLTPSDTATMDKKKVLGFLTDIGGRTSHTAIMARTLEIPAVVGLKNITEILRDDDYVSFNGETGEVVVNPDESTYKRFQQEKESFDKAKQAFKSLIGKDSITMDHRLVELSGNIGTPNDIATLMKNDAEGVGLYRTEFLYMDRETFPTEDEQYEAYKAVLASMSPKPIVIRTLDIGGDKELCYMKIDKEMNPFLGYRAIRICLSQKDIFKTQLRALLRASIYGNLKIMFPMISSLEELLEAKQVLNEVMDELDSEKISYALDIQVGMMIEVPSAVIISDVLAKHVDFFSIGTNDLIQYTCAVDRMNENITHLYNPMNPAVLRLIKLVIDNGHKEGIWVGMCGEMAGDLRTIPILLGFGLDEFSMSPASILPARKLIRSLSYEDMQKFSNKILQLSTTREIEEHVNSYF
ncbi:MAG: phosphoenolpyruvate--protein phosphotransferase [Bacillota bacterium]